MTTVRRGVPPKPSDVKRSRLDPATAELYRAAAKLLTSAATTLDLMRKQEEEEWQRRQRVRTNR